MKRMSTKRIAALLLALVMLLSVCVLPVMAEDGSEGSVSFTETGSGTIPESGLASSKAPESAEPAHADTDIVRVSIVLKDEATTEKYGTDNIVKNRSALSYRQKLAEKQAALESQISSKVLGGKALDVSWNLTLAADAISADVEYGQIAAIEALPEVEKVVLEARYEPQVVSVGGQPADPDTITSSSMTGSTAAWSSGYTGAGSRIAIIDTGLKYTHQSFDPDAFMYALEEDARNADSTVASYNLLDKTEITAALDQLNITKGYDDPYGESSNPGGELNADELYVNAKVAFGYSYIDHDYDITHDNDNQGEHGSHVAGIAAANRYIKTAPATETAPASYMDAGTAAHAFGVAPDAQLLIMKVFGNKGGAYDSDYMAAIEDAIVLGADSINLSLGSPVAGMPTDEYYQDVLDALADTDTVVAISAGNSSYWAKNSTMGYNYAEDVNFDMTGSPGSFKNSLAVASADNIGVTSPRLTALAEDEDDNVAFPYTETVYTNTLISTLDTSPVGGTRYGYVFLSGTGKAADYTDAVKEAVEGKVVFVSRGGITFSEKHKNAAEAGAIACIVYNNQPGSISMALSDSSATIPCVSIAQTDGAAIKAISTAAGDGWYTGTMLVDKSDIETTLNSKPITMSDFSSWGVPGDLSIKPEVVAPGGGIYSVNGAKGTDNSQYELMSGTSMAAPQVAGMAAIAAQYIRENDLDEETGLSVRQLSQSLLMSTATPLMDSSNEYGYFPYPVLQQGAGLANVNAAVNTRSYLLVDGQPDGKVKAELGDDPARTGVYTFSFSVNNFSSSSASYGLDAGVYTQGVFPYPATQADLSAYNAENPYNSANYMDTWLVQLGADVQFTVDGKQADSLTVAGGESADVSVTITLSDGDKADLDEYFENGNYIESYVSLTGIADGEGAEPVSLSIPVLAFYGNWSDSSMFDKVTWTDYYAAQLSGEPLKELYDTNDAQYYGLGFNTVLEYTDGTTYISKNDGKEYLNEYNVGGNPLYDMIVDDEYLPERNALNSENTWLSNVYYTLIRNAGALRLQIADARTGRVYYENTTSDFANVYDDGEGYWIHDLVALECDWDWTDQNGEALKNGTKLIAELTAAPEYYVGADGTVNWDALGKGATLSIPFAIDNVDPKLTSLRWNLNPLSLLGKNVQQGLTLEAKDDRYIAGLLVQDEDGKYIAAMTPNQTVRGETQKFGVDLSGYSVGDKFTVTVVDYAGNYTEYTGTILELATKFVPQTPSTVGEHATTQPVDTTAHPNEIFTDVADNAWYAEGVSFVYNNGLMDGVGGKLFAPDEEMTRAMLVTVMWRLAGKPAAAGTTPFTDVPAGQWYSDAVLWAYQNGIVNGVDKDLFAPMQSVTREQLAAILYRYAKMKGNDVSAAAALEGYADYAQIGVPMRAPMAWAVAKTILQGIGQNKLGPKDTATRAQLATILYRYNNFA